MRGLRWAIVALIGMGIATGVAAGSPARAEKLYVLRPIGYASNGVLINGWHWLRTSGATSEWTFDVTGLQGARSGSVYLNMTALVTKGINGGSGYSGSLSVQFVGAHTTTGGITLTNPFRPRDSRTTPTGDTQGVGYQAYGATSVSSWAYGGATTLKVIVSRSSTSVRSDIHIATSKDGPFLAYIK